MTWVADVFPEDSIRLHGTIMMPGRHVVGYGKWGVRGFTWEWDRRGRTRARITFTEEDLSQLFTHAEGAAIRAAIVKLDKGKVLAPYTVSPCPYCKARARVLQKGEATWTIQCGGFGCGQGFTGNHPTAEKACAEWAAIIANPESHRLVYESSPIDSP